MAGALLGQETNGVIDIHSGGEDNIFPHHECEIAQSCGVSGEEYFARYWFHTRHLMVEGEKMSKSKGNFYSLEDLTRRGASPAAVRLELIRSHYRSNANFTFQGLKDSQRQIERWARLKSWLSRHQDAPTPEPAPMEQALEVFRKQLCSDLNIAGAIGALNEAISQYDVSQAPTGNASSSSTLAGELAAFEAMDSVLGILDLEIEAGATGGDVDPALIGAKIAEREEARANKDWDAADRIRDELLEMNIEIKDSPEGTTWKRVVGS